MVVVLFLMSMDSRNRIGKGNKLEEKIGVCWARGLGLDRT